MSREGTPVVPSPDARDRFRALLQEAKEGRGEAKDALYREWYAPLYRFIRTRVGNNEDAQDLVNDAFLKFFTALPRFSLRGEHPLAFLYTIARNTVIDFHKKKKTAPLDPDVDVADEGAVHPERAAEEAERRAALMRALNALADDDRRIIVLRVLEQKSAREVGAILGKREDAVRQAQARALMRLRALIAKNP